MQGRIQYPAQGIGRSLPSVPDKNGVAKDGFTYRAVYFQDFDGAYYKIMLSVREKNVISTVCKVGKTKVDDIPDGNIISTIGSKADMSSTKLSISTTENMSSVILLAKIKNRECEKLTTKKRLTMLGFV